MYLWPTKRARYNADPSQAPDYRFRLDTGIHGPPETTEGGRKERESLYIYTV